MRARVLGVLVFVVCGLLRLTLRIRIVGAERRDVLRAEGKPTLHVLWHQRLAVAILGHRGTGAVTMASRSEDGTIIATFLSLWGMRATRGSSSRAGGQALREMIDALEGTTAWGALTVDGPRGPARRCKPGVALLAERLAAPVIPTGSSASRPRFLASWDRFLVPLPFSRCAVVLGEPVARAAGESEESFRARLDAAIDAATDEADRICGVTNAPRSREEEPA